MNDIFMISVDSFWIIHYERLDIEENISLHTPYRRKLYWSDRNQNIANQVREYPYFEVSIQKNYPNVNVNIVVLYDITLSQRGYQKNLLFQPLLL